jgi:hypothetical protein
MLHKKVIKQKNEDEVPKSNRIYLEIKYYTPEQGGGAYFKWIEMNVNEEKIEIRHLHNIGEGVSKKEIPKIGSGSTNSYTYKEAEAVIQLLKKGIKKLKKSKA